MTQWSWISAKRLISYHMIVSSTNLTDGENSMSQNGILSIQMPRLVVCPSIISWDEFYISNSLCLYIICVFVVCFVGFIYCHHNLCHGNYTFARLSLHFF